MNAHTPKFDALTVYRTAAGREVTVVLEGPEDPARGPMRPIRSADGGIRVGYLGANGIPTDALNTEFGWEPPGSLTPVRSLGRHPGLDATADAPVAAGAPVAVRFKHEDEVDGEPVGPMGFRYADADPCALAPYVPGRVRAPWVTRSEAVATAEAAGLPLEES